MSLLIDNAIARRASCLVLGTLLKEDVEGTVAIVKERRVGTPVGRYVHTLCPACTANGREVSRAEACSLGQSDVVVLDFTTLTAVHGGCLNDNGILHAV